MSGSRIFRMSPVFFALSGLFMIPGTEGAEWFLLAGVLLPVCYVIFVHGAFPCASGRTGRDFPSA